MDELFEQHRAYLKSVAYRMLGSTTDAEDAVQEAWLRLHRSDTLRIRYELRPQKQRWAESAQHENEDRQESAMGSHEGRVFSL